MISRNLLIAVLGLGLAVGTVADASAKAIPGVAAPTTTKIVATQTVKGKHLRTFAGKHHRILVSHRVLKRLRTVKIVGGKRIVVSHMAKRVIQKRA